MNSLLQKFVSQAIRKGNLEIVDASGAAHRFGDGSGPPVRVHFHSETAERAVLLDPEMKLGEEYMAGGYDLERGTILEFLHLLIDNIGAAGRTWWTTALAGGRFVLNRLGENNSVRRARGNVQHHYDLDGRLYSLFLDENRQYSCAYFEEGVTDLEEAQRAKMRHIAGKLDLRPGQRVLDIGSGWGGLGLYLAEHYNVDVTGVTLSDEQFAWSNRRADERGLARQTRFLLKDYRHLEGTFDRIVSVGMFEHVGLTHYREFFANVDRLLAPDGIAVIHTIAKKDDPGPINPWMRKYIFPGAYLPTLSELAPRIEKQGFWLTDLEVWRLHYADTLKAWNERFQAKRDAARALYDERFCRMWEYYLQVCELGFRYQSLCVFQVQLAKQIGAVPVTRDYMYDEHSAPSARVAAE